MFIEIETEVCNILLLKCYAGIGAMEAEKAIPGEFSERVFILFSKNDFETTSSSPTSSAVTYAGLQWTHL